MELGLVPRFDGLRPAIKIRWMALLRAEPPAPPTTASLVTPEMLVFMLDDTLSRLADQLNTPHKTRPLRRDLNHFGPMRAGCGCGLHLLLSYYLTGARALRAGLPVELGPWRVRVLHQFNQLAHDEMMALCGVCRHRDGKSCGLRHRAG